MLRSEKKNGICKSLLPNRSLRLGASIVLFVFLLGVVGTSGVLPPPNEMRISERLLPPGTRHPLGTDQYGRDVLSRVVNGVWPAFMVGSLVVLIAGGAGLLVGAWAGFRGGMLDESMMRVMDGLMAFPGLLLAVMVISILGPGLSNVAIAIGIGNIPAFARLVRADFLRLREKEFIEAARAVGASEARVIFVHILPNIIGPLLVQSTVVFATAILGEAALSYLGLGIQPPDPSWGRMLREAQAYMGRAPWLPIVPGVALTVTILGINYIGDGLRDHLARRR